MTDKDDWWKDDKKSNDSEPSDSTFSPRYVESEETFKPDSIIHEDFTPRREFADKIKKEPKRK
ncbi:hypothetical protein ABEY41_03225 [Peribacillus butanolivorans]|uniref:hypothetical protein n=1 Tax=Peribacillus butanolivorans TaxID=421767 RepID=UPI003D27C511